MKALFSLKRDVITYKIRRGAPKMLAGIDPLM
jgi:hypothetical protein